MFLVIIVLQSIVASGQETQKNKLRLNIPVLDLPQNIRLPYNYPSMNQALEWSADFYELSFWGIDELGDALFISDTRSYTGMRKFTNNAFKYIFGLGFSKYGSELPVPIKTKYLVSENFSGFVSISGKTGGWILGNPYLGNSVSMQFGLAYELLK